MGLISGLVDVIAGRQSFKSWLTGRDPNDDNIYANYQKIETAVSSLKKISNEELKTAQDRIYAAFGELNRINGISTYVGPLDAQYYDRAFEVFKDVINDVATSIESKAASVKAYEEKPLGVKLGSSLCMSLCKLGEGIFSVAEELGDGIVSVVGWVGGKLGAEGVKAGAEKFVKSNWSHDMFNFYYDTDFAKASAFTEESAIAGGIKFVGKVTGYVAAGYLTTGALGLSTTATYGTGILKASGATIGGTVSAGIGGLGSGTDVALNAGLEYDEAFKYGVKQGLKSAAVAFVAGKVGEKVSEARAAKKAGGTDTPVDVPEKPVTPEGGGPATPTTPLLPAAGESSAGKAAAEAGKDAAAEAGKDAVAEAGKEAGKASIKEAGKNIVSKIGSASKKVVSGIVSHPGKALAAIAENGIPKVTGGGLGTALAAAAVNPPEVAREVFEAPTIQDPNIPQTTQLDDLIDSTYTTSAIQKPDDVIGGGVSDTDSNVDIKPIIETDPPSDVGSIIPDYTPQTSATTEQDYQQTQTYDNITTPQKNYDNNTSSVDPIVNPSTSATNDIDPIVPTSPITNSTPIIQEPDTTGSSSGANNGGGNNGGGSNGGGYVYTSSAQPVYTGGGYTQPIDEGISHSGAEFDGTDLTQDSLEMENVSDLDVLEELDSFDDSTASLQDVIENNNVKQIPKIDNPITTNKKSTNSVIPIAAGLSVAAAAGIGAKAYMDYKKNNSTGEEEYDGEYDGEYEDDFSTDETEEWQGDEETVVMDENDGVMTNDAYIDEDEYYQEDSSYKARNASELSELQ